MNKIKIQKTQIKNYPIYYLFYLIISNIFYISINKLSCKSIHIS